MRESMSLLNVFFLIVDPILLGENTGQQKVVFTHILCGDPSFAAKRVEDADLTFDILANGSLKACRIHGINSKVIILL